MVAMTATNIMCAVDGEMIKDADRFKMDLVGGLERTLHGQVKPSMYSNYLDLANHANITQ